MRVSRYGKWLLLGSLMVGSVGCGKVLHNLKAHRLHRMNRVPDMMDDNAYNFSIPAPPVPNFEASEPRNVTDLGTIPPAK